MKNIRRVLPYGSLSAALITMLCAALPAQAGQEEKSFSDMVSHIALTAPDQPASDALARATDAVNALKRMDLRQASKSANEALQLDDRNSYLHFLNGFIYHLQARQGDSQKNELAVEGYQQALRLDPGNWIAQEFLGLAYMDLKQFAPAKEQFAQALLMTPDSTVSIWGLMVASYLTGDATTACAMADQFRKYSPQPDAGFIRSSISVYASCGNFDKAVEMREAFGKLASNPMETERADQRLAQWKAFYAARTPSGPPQGKNSEPQMFRTSLSSAPSGIASEQLASAFTVTSRDASSVPSPSPAYVPPATPAFSSLPPQQRAAAAAAASPTPDVADGTTPGMVLVDVVMVSTQEVITASKGVNLLNALTLQLGSATAPGFSRTFDSSSASGTVITRAVTIPALSYSLNIANANSALNQVLARPTLAAIADQPSEFFSGTNLSAGVLSTSALGSASVVPVDKRFGVKLAVTPSFLPNGMIKLKVDAERTFLNADTNSNAFAYRLDIAETSTNANVVMKLGDTLVLSGLSEKETAKTRDGVPVLQDVPVVQYLFSNKRDIDYQRSVLMLITPRAPAYTAKAEGNAEGTMPESLKALREKLGFSERTPSNVESILNHLKTSDLFREFRQGDVSMEPWDRTRSTGDRLRQALDFLYY